MNVLHYYVFYCTHFNLNQFHHAFLPETFSAANWFVCGLETFLLGGACATVAYTIGQFVDGLVSDS